MGFGGEDEGRGGRPMNEIKDIGEHLKDCGYREGKDYDFIVMELKPDADPLDPDQLDPINVKRKFAGIFNKMRTKKHGRLIFVIDRRDPNKLKNDEEPSYSLDNKDWPDRIYCIRPKQHCQMPDEYRLLPESLFCLSQELMLPSLPSKRQSIGIKEALNGYMFTLQYHVYSESTCRVYFGYNGQVQRFLMEDINALWPRLFVDSSHNQQVRPHPHHKMTRKFADPEFDYFMKHFQ